MIAQWPKPKPKPSPHIGEVAGLKSSRTRTYMRTNTTSSAVRDNTVRTLVPRVDSGCVATTTITTEENRE